MNSIFSELPKDPNELRSVAQLMVETVKNQALEIEKLKHQLDGARRHRFGSRSETADQLGLDLDEQKTDDTLVDEAWQKQQETDDKAEAEQKTDKPKRKPLPKSLPRETKRIEPDGPDSCEGCGGSLKTLSEDTSEVLEYVPGHFVIQEIVRPRKACRCGETIVQAPMPHRAIDKGRYGSGFIAHIAVSKFCDHLPLYRQSQIYTRDGIDVPRSSMALALTSVAKLCQPLYEHLLKHITSGDALFADDTVMRLQPSGHPSKPQSKGQSCTQARFWTYARDERPFGSQSPPAVAFEFKLDRKGKHPCETLKDYKGFVHADGFSGFNQLWEKNQAREMACMAHVRRDFVDLIKSQDSEVGSAVVGEIAKLYAIEKQARGMPPDQRAKLRQVKAKPILDALEIYLNQQLPRISGKTPLAKDIRHALKRIPKIRPYLDHGFLELDNNTVERCIRPVALGRKNYLFVGSVGGGETAAIFYSLIGTAKLNDVCPRAYLTWLFDTIPSHPINDMEALTPWLFKAQISPK